MKITLQKSNITKALNYASRAVASKPNIPILSNVMLSIQDDQIAVSATNLEMGLKLIVDGKAETEGKTTVHAKFLSEFISAASGEFVDIFLKENNLNVETSNSKAKFNTINADEFPVLPQIPETPIFSMTVDGFRECMNKVLFAASTDFTAGKMQQTGVLFDFVEGASEIDFVAVDSFRLSRKTLAIFNKASEIQKEEIIVPAKYIADFTKIISDYEKETVINVYLSQNSSQIIFKVEEMEFSVRLLDGPYPDYKRILPDTFSYTFQIPVEEFTEALKVINTFARGNLGNKVLFDFDLETGSIVLKSAVSEIGGGETSIQVFQVDGESDLNTAYTLRFLQDFVASCTSSTIVFETKGSMAATVLKDKEDDSYLHLIMPMRRD